MKEETDEGPEWTESTDECEDQVDELKPSCPPVGEEGPSREEKKGRESPSEVAEPVETDLLEDGTTPEQEEQELPDNGLVRRVTTEDGSLTETLFRHPGPGPYVLGEGETLVKRRVLGVRGSSPSCPHTVCLDPSLGRDRRRHTLYTKSGSRLRGIE